MKEINWLTVVSGVFGGIVVATLGEIDKFLIALVWLSAFDYLTGVLKGVYTHTLSSEIGYKGIAKKVFYFILVAATFQVQQVIGVQLPIRETMIMFLITNEALSIIENAAVFDVAIPSSIKSYLLQLRDKEDKDSKDETQNS